VRPFEQPSLGQLHEREPHDFFVGRQSGFGRHGGGQASDCRVAVGVPPHAGGRRIQLVHAQRVLVKQQAIALEILDNDVGTSCLRLHPVSPHRGRVAGSSGASYQSLQALMR
jgi:hypothetical protein